MSTSAVAGLVRRGATREALRGLVGPVIAGTVFSLSLIGNVLVLQHQSESLGRVAGAATSPTVSVESARLRFVDAVDRFVLDRGVERRVAVDRLDDLRARVDFLLEDESYARLRATRGVATKLRAFAATLAALEPEVAALQRGDETALRSVRASVDSWSGPLRHIAQIVVGLNNERLEAEIATHSQWTLFSFGGVVVTGLYILLSLLRVTRQSLGLVEERESARRDAEHARIVLMDAVQAIPEGFALHDSQRRLVLSNPRYREMYASTPDPVLASGYVTEADGATPLPLPQADPGGAAGESAHPRWVRVLHRKTLGGDRVSIHVDVTELEERVRERTDELAVANDRLRQLERAVECADDGIVVIDAGRSDLPVVYVNPAFEQLTGYTRTEVSGRNLRFLQGEDRDQPELATLRAAIDELRPEQVTLRNYRKDGTMFWNRLGVAPVLDGEGRLTHFVGVMDDVTGIRHYQESLARALDEAQSASRAKSLFLANVSHELRTPLNAIIGYSDLLADEARGRGGDPTLPDLERIHDAGRRLLELVDGVLEFSRAESGEMALTTGPIDVRTLVEEVAAAAEPLAARGRNRLRVRCGETVGVVTSDADKVRQALGLLLDNAAKFTEAGEIAIEAEREGQSAAGQAHIVFRVRDTGPGIDAQTVARLFEPFAQGDRDEVARYSGAGLGLALCRRLCRLLGGDVEVESAPGAGSTFTIRLPAELPA